MLRQVDLRLRSAKIYEKLTLTINPPSLTHGNIYCENLIFYFQFNFLHYFIIFTILLLSYLVAYDPCRMRYDLHCLLVR